MTLEMMSDKKQTGRPKEYEGEMQKKNLRLPKYIWEWLNNLAANRTKALVKLYESAMNKSK
jgi:hypothetical protein